MKSKIRTAVFVVILAPVAYVVWSFAQLFIGTGIANETNRQLLVADRMIKAFSAYPESHGGHYPAFRNPDEATRELRPFLETEASQVNPEGHPYTTLNELESQSRKAVWDQALSSGTANGPYSSSPAWVFYFQRNDQRSVLAWESGKVTIVGPEELARIVSRPPSGQ
ncbi:MAG: hypothetical protein P4L46_05190 [Fimbriimonas sp.]|nr:hypothetical protein [Fimbriimonas sp.]